MAAAPEGLQRKGVLVFLSMGHHFLNFPWHYFKPRLDALCEKLKAFHAKLPKVLHDHTAIRQPFNAGLP
jgi:hypothetical protein